MRKRKKKPVRRMKIRILKETASIMIVIVAIEEERFVLSQMLRCRIIRLQCCFVSYLIRVATLQCSSDKPESMAAATKMCVYLR